MRRKAPVLLAVLLALSACSDVRRARRAAISAVYDPTSGRLVRLAHDSNINGKPDTWTAMNGATPISSTADRNEDGRIDRWEYYDAAGKLTKVGFSRKSGETPDAWAYAGPGGGIDRIETSSTGDAARIDRWEIYDASQLSPANAPDNPGTLLRVEEDTNGDGRADKWERYTAGMVSSVEFDENHDGRPDRRLTYKDSELTLIETSPDASGAYQKQIGIGRR